MPRPALSSCDRARGFVRRACLIAAVSLVVSALTFFPFAGRFLLREDPLVEANAIFVLGGTRAERWLEAVDLYRERRAPLIVLSPENREAAELIVLSRGVKLPSRPELGRQAIVQLGVPTSSVVLLPGSLDNTAQEAGALRDLAARNGWHTVIVVTSKYHTRRARFALARAFNRSGVRIVMRASRYDPAQPARWWRSRADVWNVASELEKLLAYWAGLAG